MHEQSIIDTILSRLDVAECQVIALSLVCSPEQLRARLCADVAKGLRSKDIITRSMPRLALYDTLKTVKINTDHSTPQEIARKISLIGEVLGNE